MAFQFTFRFEGAQAFSALICFPSFNGFSSSPVTKDLAEVCPLSGWVCLLFSSPICAITAQPSLFLRSSARSTLSFPYGWPCHSSGDTSGLPRSACSTFGWFRLALFTGSAARPRQVAYIPVPAPLPVWLKPPATPSACSINDVYQAFTCVSLAIQSWPYPFGVFRKMVVSRFPSPPCGGLALSEELSQETVSRLPCPRRILPVERQVLSSFRQDI